MLLLPLSTLSNPAELREAGFSWQHRLKSAGRVLDTFKKGTRWQIVLRNPRDKQLTTIAIFDCTLKQMQTYIKECDQQEQLTLAHLQGI